MKVKHILIAMAAISASNLALAGDFYTIPGTTPNATLVSNNPTGSPFVSNNPNSDRFYIESKSTNWLNGYDELVPTSITYNAIATSGGNPRPVIGTGTLTLLSYRVTEDITLDGAAVGDAYDFVFRDSRDDKLVFGSRVILGAEEYHDVGNGELNYLFRTGFSGFSVATAWTFASDNDLKLYQAALTSDYSYNTTVPTDLNTVRMKSDISVAEGNPLSGLFLIKTDAQYYTLGDKAFGYYQAGEEGQAIVGEYITGFIPTAVPEPENFALMIAGFGLIGAANRRRKSK